MNPQELKLSLILIVNLTLALGVCACARWPIMGHNRFWAVDNVYASQNGGGYEFVVEKKGDEDGRNYAWPMEQRFWDDLLYNSSKWGLFMYEQDWLDTEYDNVMYLNKNASAARTWLLQMGTAAARNDLTIQYCMSHCRHIMQSVEIPAVTNARASGDYHPGGDQWKPIGTTGIFAWSVAIAPTKDNYWSTDKQPGAAYSDYLTVSEPYNRLQAAVSTLSKGPVAPSDKIGASDAKLIMKSCAMDGKLLQGDKPAMTLDSLHKRKAFGTTASTSAASAARAPGAEADVATIKAELASRLPGVSDEIWATSTTLNGMPLSSRTVHIAPCCHMLSVFESHTQHLAATCCLYSSRTHCTLLPHAVCIRVAHTCSVLSHACCSGGGSSAPWIHAVCICVFPHTKG